MAKEREFEGKDLEEALHTAAQALDIAEPELDYEIVEQGRRGLFGMGAKSVRIRVMPPLPQPSDPLAATELKGSRERRPKRERPPRQERPPRRERQDKVQAREPRPKRERREPREKREPQETLKTPEKPAEPAPEAAQVAETVQRMLALMGMELEAHPAPSDNGVGVALDGADRKLFTQKDGELMAALQFVLNRMARRTWPEVSRVHLICDGHRKKRDEDLVELTREVAQQVRRTGRTKRLHPMNAYERRLVHITIREFEQLGSRSEGNGHLKRVKIYRQQQRQAAPNA